MDHQITDTLTQYDKNLRCDRCGGRSDLGWYYRCCHETDARLFESIRNGNEVTISSSSLVPLHKHITADPPPGALR